MPERAGGRSKLKRLRGISPKVVERLSVYRRTLINLEANGARRIFSHELARLCDSTPARVRRDLMVLDVTGSPGSGYSISSLLKALENFFASSHEHNVVLVGIGNLGRALLGYFERVFHRHRIVAAFDRDPEKIGRIIAGVRTFSSLEMKKLISDLRATLAILALPAGVAQSVTDELVLAGIKGILNFAPVALRVPEDVWVENVDITAALDKLAFFASNRSQANVLSNVAEQIYDVKSW